MFAGRTSAKVARLKEDPHASVLVTNQVGEPEAWVAFDAEVIISDFVAEDWQSLIDPCRATLLGLIRPRLQTGN